MIGRVARLAAGSGLLAWLADRWLAGRAAIAGRPAIPAIASRIVIDAPIERVWAELADIEGQPRWMHDIVALRMLTPPPYGVGSRGEATVRAMGVSVIDTVTITVFDPPHRYAITHDGTIKGGGLITLESGADGTTTIVRWEERLVPPVLPHLGSAAIGAVFGPIFQADLERLRGLVETGPTA